MSLFYIFCWFVHLTYAALLLHKPYTLPGGRIAEPEILQIPPDFSQSEYNRTL